MRHKTGSYVSCERCGKEFYCKPYRASWAVFCSRACKWFVEPSKVRIDGGLAFIEVENESRGFKGEAIVSLNDLDRVMAVGRKWYATWHKTSFSYYARANIGNAKTALLHRVVTGAPVGMDVDHINHDMLDCRQDNLRVCTRSENLQNRRGAMVTSRSGVRGVHWDKNRHKWVATVRVSGRNKHLGRYDDMRDAERAAQEGRRRYMTHSSECR